MNKTIAIGILSLLATTSGTAAPSQEAHEAENPGRRLRVELRETRRRGEETTAVRSYALLLHADAGAASVFVGPVVAMTTSAQGTLSTQFRNAGAGADVSVESLPGGDYRLHVKFEDSSPLGSGGGVTDIRTADNPVLATIRGTAQLRIREGETVPFLTAVDPSTREVVRVDATVTAAPEPAPAAAAGGASRLHARLVLVRRQGETILARRPYSIVVDASADEDALGEAFGGSMLPVQAPHQGNATVMLRDLGTGLRVTARRISDGRYRLQLGLSDGVLSAADGSPRMHVFRSDSVLFVGAGETIAVASAADPDSGEIVEAELSLLTEP